MALAIGVVWFRNPPEQASRWLAHVARAAQTAIGDGRLNVPPTLHSVDNSLAVGRSGEPVQLPLPGIGSHRIHPSAGNVGFGPAHNRLMATAFAEGADFYLCLNPDAMLHHRALSELMPLVTPEANALYELRQFPAEHPKHYAADTGETLWVSGCAFLIPRSVHERVGGFDEAFFMYCEDVDLSWRVRLSGGRCIMVPRALVHHDTANRKPDPDLDEHILRSGYYLGAKWGLRRLAGQCARGLRRRGAPLPPAPGERIRARSIATGAYGFSFSPTRW